MKYSEFKQRLKEIFKPTNAKEQERLDRISRKRIQGIGLCLKDIHTDKDVLKGWFLYNKKEADWEKYCRKEKQKNRNINWNEVFNYSCNGFNNEAEDF